MSIRYIRSGTGFVLLIQTDGNSGIYADAAARDVYFATANGIIDLARMDANQFIIIKLLNDGAGAIAYQQRSGGAFIDVTSLVQGESGPAGATGNSFFFESVVARDAFFNTGTNFNLLMTGLPVVVNEGNAVTTFVWLGADAPGSYDASLFEEQALNSGPGTLFLGLSGTNLSSAAKAINFTSAYGDKALALGSFFTNKGSITPFDFTLEKEQPFVVTSVFDTQLAPPFSFEFASSSVSTYNESISFRPATTGVLVLRAYAGINNTFPIIIDKRITVAGGDIGTVVKLSFNGILTTPVDARFFELTGIDLFGGLQTSGSFNGQTKPYLETAVHISDAVRIASTADIDRYYNPNKEYLTAALKTGGLAVTSLPTATTDTFTNATFIAGIASTSNPQVITVGAATFSAADIITIVHGTDLVDSGLNDGLYEVLTHASNTLTIKGVGNTATVEDFTKDQFTFLQSTGTITKVGVSVLRATATDFEIGFGNTTPITFTSITQIGGFTEGSVPFADNTGKLTQDNANLFWDDANNILKLGTAGAINASTGTELLPTYSFTAATAYGMRYDSVAGELAFSNKGFDALKLAAEADTTAFLKVTAVDNETGGVDNGNPLLIEVESTTTDASLELRSKNAGPLDLNTHATGGDVEIGRDTGGTGFMLVSASTGEVKIGEGSGGGGGDGQLLLLQGLPTSDKTKISLRSPTGVNILSIESREFTTSTTTLSVDNSNTFSRLAGSFVDNGFVAGQTILSSGFTGGNNGTFTVSVVAALTMNIVETTLSVEVGTGDEKIFATGVGDADFRTNNAIIDLHTSAGRAVAISGLDVNMAGRVAVGSPVDPISDLTVFQSAPAADKGLTFSGSGLLGSSTTDGPTLLAGNIGAGNMQLWLCQHSDIGDTAKTSFRYTVGSKVPNVGAVDGTNTINRNLSLGNLISRCGFGFDVLSLEQADIDGMVHISSGAATTPALIAQGVTAQTADLFQARNVSDSVLFGVGPGGGVTVRRVATAASTNTDDEVIIGVTSTATAVTVTIQTADIVDGRLFVIKDESGAASVNNITVATQGAQTIDGATTVAISQNYGVARLYSNGTNLFSW